MRAAAIFFFARVMRAAIVGSLTRNARATSAVVSPQSSRSVSATCASARQRRVAAGEDQAQPVVGDLGRRPAPARRARRRPSTQQRQRAADSVVAAEQVEGAVAARPSSARRPGWPARPLRPRRQRAGVRVLHALLGQVEVARDAHRRGEHEGPLATVRVGDGAADRRPPDGRRSAQSKTMIGRTSTPPSTPGTSLGDARSPRRGRRPRPGSSRRAPPSSRRTGRR